jgi:hypothetical protein
MSARVGDKNFSNIGSMFARLNMPEIYGKAKPGTTAPVPVPDGNGSVDQVKLSPQVPKPLPARLFEEAAGTGRELSRGERLTTKTMARLREDRVFAAVSALSAMVENGTEILNLDELDWPGGVPVPTREEMEMARRRLAQRLKDIDAAGNPDAARREREELWFRVAKKNWIAAPGKNESLSGTGWERDGTNDAGR